MKIEGEYTTAEVKLPEGEVEESLKEEIQEQTDNKGFQNSIKYMPDVHGGLGPHAIVGFSMKLGDRIIPNSVGGDIGCGMTALKLKGVNADFDDINTLRSVNEEVRESVPMGTGRVNDRSEKSFEDLYTWPHANVELKMMFEHLYESASSWETHKFRQEYFENLCERVGISQDYAKNSLGSLGSGNHFIEISESQEDGSIWVVVHSGSRNLGQKVCSYHQERATEKRNAETGLGKMSKEEWEYAMEDGSPDWEKIKRDFDGEKIGQLGDAIASYGPDSNRNTKLDYLKGEEMFGYLKDMVFAQQYASDNRRLMAKEVASILGATVGEVINSPHNYVDFRDGVIRKGSTRSAEDETFIVPMNMEDGTLVCRGKGNPDWIYSAPHGAGRLGSRGWAHEQFDADEARKRMYDNGTYSANVPGDEVPEAYKDTELIEKHIKPTAEITDRLIPRMNFKA